MSEYRKPTFDIDWLPSTPIEKARAWAERKSRIGEIASEPDERTGGQGVEASADADHAGGMGEAV